MSKQNRKISYWSFDFVADNEHFFDEGIFCRFMAYLDKLEAQQLLLRVEKQNKAISVESILCETKHEKQIYKVVFKSCKYNHSPDYMSSLDGSERPTDKLLSEGDKELTHMCFRIDESEAFTIFEERRNGVTIGAVVNYYNRLLKSYIHECCPEIKDDTKLCPSIIPPDDFLTALRKTNRISAAEMFIEKKVIGTGYLDLMDIDANSQEDIVITMKAKPRQSLNQNVFEKAYISLLTGGTEITRIRIRGKDINQMNVTIDSLNGKKVDMITVKLLENGIVDSSSLFNKMEELLAEA